MKKAISDSECYMKGVSEKIGDNTWKYLNMYLLLLASILNKWKC